MFGLLDAVNLDFNTLMMYISERRKQAAMTLKCKVLTTCIGKHVHGYLNERRRPVDILLGSTLFGRYD